MTAILHLDDLTRLRSITFDFPEGAYIIRQLARPGRFEYRISHQVGPVCRPIGTADDYIAAMEVMEAHRKELAR